MSLSSQVGLLATRIGTEIKSVRNSYVPNALRGPIGGVTESTGVTGAVNLDPTLTNQRRLIATGDITIAAMGAGADGQRLLLEINASGGQRVVTFDASYEVSRAVTTRTFTIPSGSWAYIALIYRANGATWRLVSAEPQATVDTTPPSMWLPSDHGLLAWSIDPGMVDFTLNLGSGFLGGSLIKVSVSDVNTGVSFNINTAGSGFTSGRQYIGLYDPNGALVATSPEQTTNWGTAGLKNVSWNSSVSVSPGQYYVGFICTATTLPVFAAATGGFGAITRGRSAMGWRGSYSNTTSYSTLPATRPTPTNTMNVPWFGLS